MGARERPSEVPPSSDVRAIFDDAGDRWRSLYSESAGQRRFALFQGAVSRRVLARRKLAVGLLDPQPGERVIDVGCGNGAYRSEVEARGARWIGVDVSLTMLRSGKPGAGLIVADGAAVPIASSSADRVLCVGVLSYYRPDALDRLMKELCRITRPGGYVVISALRLDPITWLRSRAYSFLPVPISVPGPLHPMGADRLLPRLTALPFSERARTDVEKYGFLPHYELLCLEKTAEVPDRPPAPVPEGLKSRTRHWRRDPGASGRRPGGARNRG